MASFHLTKKAVDDLAEIWNYTIDTWTENQADRYYQMLLVLLSAGHIQEVFGTLL